MSIKQQRGSTQGLVVVSWSRCCGLRSFWGDGERVFLGEGKPDLKYDTFFFFSLFIGGLFSSFHPLREWGTAHLLLTELVSFCNQDLLSAFFSQHFSLLSCGVTLPSISIFSTYCMCVFFSLSLYFYLFPIFDMCVCCLFLSLLILCMFFLIYFIKCQLLILLLEFIPCYKMLPHSH